MRTEGVREMENVKAKEQCEKEEVQEGVVNREGG